MSKYSITPTLEERTFEEDELIVSKTDLRGRLTYANSVFLRLALYQESEVLDQPHSMIRHPDMPRCVFKLAWERIEAGKEIFAYVKNMAKDGAFYWVFAHITPSFDAQGAIQGYHSNRRCPRPEALEAIEPIYRDLLAIEERHQDRKAGMKTAYDQLGSLLKARGQDYDSFIFSI